MNNRDLEYAVESVKLRFIAEMEEGRAPKLQDYIRRYPQFADDLTEFVLLFTSLENAAERMTESPVASDATLNRIEDIVRRSAAPVKNLTEARNAMGWTLARFADELNVPRKAAMRLVRGLREWPEKVEVKLSEVLERPLAEVRQLLQNTKPIPATAFKATQQPRKSTAQPPTWQEVLDECAGELTDGQRREWLENF